MDKFLQLKPSMISHSKTLPLLGLLILLATQTLSADPKPAAEWVWEDAQNLPLSIRVGSDHESLTISKSSGTEVVRGPVKVVVPPMISKAQGAALKALQSESRA